MLAAPIDAERRHAAAVSVALLLLMLAVAAGDPIPMDEVLATYPVRLSSVRDYARQALNG